MLLIDPETKEQYDIPPGDTAALNQAIAAGFRPATQEEGLRAPPPVPGEGMKPQPEQSWMDLIKDIPRVLENQFLSGGPGDVRNMVNAVAPLGAAVNVPSALQGGVNLGKYGVWGGSPTPVPAAVAAGAKVLSAAPQGVQRAVGGAGTAVSATGKAAKVAAAMIARNKGKATIGGLVANHLLGDPANLAKILRQYFSRSDDDLDYNQMYGNQKLDE